MLNSLVGLLRSFKTIKPDRLYSGFFVLATIFVFVLFLNKIDPSMENQLKIQHTHLLTYIVCQQSNSVPIIFTIQEESFGSVFTSYSNRKASPIRKKVTQLHVLLSSHFGSSEATIFISNQLNALKTDLHQACTLLDIPPPFVQFHFELS